MAGQTHRTIGFRRILAGTLACVLVLGVVWLLFFKQECVSEQRDEAITDYLPTTRNESSKLQESELDLVIKTFLQKYDYYVSGEKILTLSFGPNGNGVSEILIAYSRSSEIGGCPTHRSFSVFYKNANGEWNENVNPEPGVGGMTTRRISEKEYIDLSFLISKACRTVLIYPKKYPNGGFLYYDWDLRKYWHFQTLTKDGVLNVYDASPEDLGEAADYFSNFDKMDTVKFEVHDIPKWKEPSPDVPFWLSEKYE